MPVNCAIQLMTNWWTGARALVAPDEPSFRTDCQVPGHAHLMHLTTIHPDPTHLTLSESLEASCEATAVRHGGAVPVPDSGA
jgi:hypothetical protein